MKAVKMLADHFPQEMYACYLYLAGASALELMNLDNLAEWMRKHAQEEYSHAVKIMNYLLARNYPPSFHPIEAVKTSVFKTPADVFTVAFEHEQKVSASFQSIAEQCSLEHDHTTYAFIQWFLQEQVEEEDLLAKYVSRLQNNEAPQLAAIIIDAELAE